jgi:putative membrane protein
MEKQKVDQRNINTLLYVVGAVLAIAVGLIYITPKIDMSGTWMDGLPALNATINGTVCLLLIMGLLAIKQKKISFHRICMTTALILSVLFLVSYVGYHLTHESTKYGGEDGMVKNVYLFILLTHILLAMVTAPLVLIAFTRALSERFDKHKKIARIAYPIWLYVSITGVIVYLMVSPYY